MELFVWENGVLTKANKLNKDGAEIGFIQSDAEYYARKTCRNCWSKGWNFVQVPTGQSFNQVCSCAITRYKKATTL